MTDTLFKDKVTHIESDWLNDVNDVAYGKDGNPYKSETGGPLVNDKQVAVKRAATGSVLTDLGSWIEGQRYDPKVDFGAIGNGTANDTTKVQAAITAAQLDGGVVYIDRNYGIDASLLITSKITLVFSARGKLTALAGFPAPARSGPNMAEPTWMVNINGANTDNTVVINPNLDGGAKAGGIYLNANAHVPIYGGHITDMAGPGVYYQTSSHSSVMRAKFERCGVDPLGTDTGSVWTTTLRGSGGRANVFAHNVVLASWGKGIVFSGSNDCEISGNFVLDCTKDFGTCYFTSTSERLKIHNNIGIQGETTGAAEVVKVSVSANYCSVQGNTFIQNLDKDIISIVDNNNCLLEGNTFRVTVATVTNRQAVRVDTEGGGGGQNLVIKANRFYGSSAGTAIAISYAKPSVTGNTFYDWNQGIQISASGGVANSNTFINCNVKQLFGGASVAHAEYSRLIFSRNSDASNTGTSAENVGGTTLAANTIDRATIVRVHMAGTKTGAGGTKTVAFRLGTTDVVFNPAANDTNNWSATVTINFALVGGVTWTPRIHVLGWNGTTAFQSYSTANEDPGTALYVGPRLTVVSGGDLVTVKMMLIELLGQL